MRFTYNSILLVFIFYFSILNIEIACADSSNDSVLLKVEELINIKDYKLAVLQLEKYHSAESYDWLYYRISGKLNYYLSDYNKAIEDYNKAIKLLKFDNSEYDSISSYLYNNLGACYYRLGSYDKAAVNFAKALSLKKEIFTENDEVFISGYNNLAILYRRMGKFELALKFFTESEEIAKQVNSYEKYGSILMNKANLYKDINRIEEAIVFYNLSAEIAETSRNYESLKNVINSIGNLYLNTGEYNKSIDYYLKCNEIIIANNLNEDSKVYNNLGLAYFKIHNYILAEENVKHSIKIEYLKNVCENYNLTNTFLNLSDIYLAQNQTYKADLYLKKALQFSEKNLQTSHPYYIRALTLKADYYAQLKNYTEAEKYYDFALGSFQNNELKPLAQELSFVNISSKKAELLLLRSESTHNLNDKIQALSIYTELTNLIHRLNATYYNESNQLRFIKNKKDIIDRGLHLAYELYQETCNSNYLASAFYFSEMGKASVLNSLLNEQRAIASSTIPDSLIDAEKQINTQIAYYENTLYSDEGEMDEKARDNLLNLYKEKENLITFFENNFNSYYLIKFQPLSIDLAEFQNALAENETAFEFTLTDSSLFTFHISNNQVQLSRQDISKNFIEDLFYLHNFVNYNSWIESNSEHFAKFKDISNKVYNVLLANYKEQLKDKRLVIIPDAELSYIPFEILLQQRDADVQNYSDLSYLIKSNSISYKYSATTFKYVEKEKSNAMPELVAFAPTYNGSSINSGNNTRGVLSNLIGAKSEINFISKLFKSRKYLGNDASESAFKSEVSKAGILHLALHGIIDSEKPMLSKLVFSESAENNEDGLLNMYEIFNLELNLDMLVLSACNTGFGDYKDGEGIISFARSFINAGCPGIIMTLWPINDFSGSELMKSFYSYLGESKTKDEALRLAKLDYITKSDPTKTHPYFWAGYVSLGDTSNYNFTKPKKIIYAYLPVLFIVSIFLIAFFKKR